MVTRTETVYGLTDKDIEARLYHQRNACAICRRTFTDALTYCVDHRHRDGLVRGLLCNHCNTELGRVQENRGWLENAAQYLQTWGESTGDQYIPDSIGESGAPLPPYCSRHNIEGVDCYHCKNETAKDVA